MSSSKTEHIEKYVAYHLGHVKRDFETGVLDETSSKISMRRISLSIWIMVAHSALLVTKNVKYADVVSGGEGITMIVRLTGGKGAQIETTFLMFINKSRKYPL